MTMTKDHKAALAALEAATSAISKALKEVEEAELAVKDRRAALELAYEARAAAQKHADGFLPAVVIVNYSRYGGRSRSPGVIVKRTDKTITAKLVGNGDELALQFRQSKYRSGVWKEHPAPRGYSSTSRELEFPAA